LSISAIERRILNCIQDEIPLNSRPFKTISQKIGIEEEVFLENLRKLREKGIIRGFSARVSHKKLGFESSLVALKIPENEIDLIVRDIIAYPEVTHCFLRKGEYNLWIVFISKNGKLNNFLAHLGEKIGPENILNLPTRQQFKLKTRLKI
jgi:DNA-binding Lrp family transcriptional regulator